MNKDDVTLICLVIGVFTLPIFMYLLTKLRSRMNFQDKAYISFGLAVMVIVICTLLLDKITTSK